MKVVTGQGMKEIDEEAIKRIGIPSLVLMENAGRSAFLILKERVPELKGKEVKVTVLAGKGNNGGDGLVVARYLLNLGAKVEIFILGKREELSPETLTNSKILEKMEANLTYLPDEEALPKLAGSLKHADLIIDALLGIGVKGPVRGYYAKVIELVNASSRYRKVKIVSIDLPSGLEADTGHIEGPCVQADLTITMELPKLGCLLYPGKDYVGDLIIAEIGYPQSVKERYESKLELVDEAFVQKRLPQRRPYSHKGSYGKIFVLAGSKGYTGAAALSAESALRVGAGLVYLGIPESLNPILEEKLTEVITLPLAEEDGALSYEALPQIEAILKDKDVDVFALGPGLSRRPQVAKLVKDLLPKVRVPMVIDADAINALAGKPEVLKKVKAQVILTPHPGELSRMISKTVPEIEAERVGVAREVAREFNVVLVLKGVPTITALPSGEAFINSTGNTGLASGGSGDVLTGMIAGLLGQKLQPKDAAPLGAYLHGLIADRLKTKLGERGMIAGDLVKEMPYVLKGFEC